jgi:hypothetical protein
MMKTFKFIFILMVKFLLLLLMWRYLHISDPLILEPEPVIDLEVTVSEYSNVDYLS